MRILFIGNENLQNEAIIEIVKSENSSEIDWLLPVNIEEQAVISSPYKYIVSLADLSSFPYKPDVSIQLIKNNNMSDHIIAIHKYRERNLIKPIIDAGADFYFSVDSGPDILLDKINKLVKVKR